MKSPKNMTELVKGGALVEIQENFGKLKLEKNQSSEEFTANLSFEKAFNLEAKCDEFLGDSDDSTEISFILSSLSSSNFSSNANYENTNNLNSNINNNLNNLNNNYYNNNNNQSENDSENTEILNILNRHPKPVKSIPCYSGSFKNSEFTMAQMPFGKKTSLNAPALRPIPIKKISMAGKVLTSMDSTKDSESVSPVNNRKSEFFTQSNKPERASNPLFKKNCNKDFDNNLHHIEKFQLKKL